MANNHLQSPDSEAAVLLREYAHLFLKEPQGGPVLDLACGRGRNGIYLATLGVSVVLCDISEEALSQAKILAQKKKVSPQFLVLDLEKAGESPLASDSYGGIIVFRYLHRPLIPVIKEALCSGGVLIYETFTVDQVRFGKPTNPDFLLQPGELRECFADWESLHYFEGIQNDPERAVAQIVCRKP